MDGNSSTTLVSSGGSTWKVERQQNQSFSQQTTRVLHSQVRVSSAKIPHMTEFSSLMDKDSSNSQQSDLVELMRKKMQINADKFASKRLEAMSQFMNSGNENFISSGNVLAEGNGLKGGVTAAFFQDQGKSLDGGKIKVFGDTRSASLQGKISSANGNGNETQVSPWIGDRFNEDGLLNANQKVSATTVSQRQFTISNSSTHGVTRSFSSGSGLPSISSIVSSKSNSEDIPENDDPQSKLICKTDGPMIVPLSPRRSPVFTFRNFENRPLWTDSIFPTDTDLFKHNRKTWDLSSDFTTKAQVHFSASQSHHVFESSSDGTFRAAAYQDRLFLRQSYGPSESEESEGEDDDFIMKKAIGYKVKPGLNYKQRIALCDKPYEPSEAGTTSSVEIQDLDEPIEGDIEDQPPSSPENNQKAFKVAQELVETERTYVKILHLIDQIFHFRVAQENRSQQMFPPETVNQMFCNIKSIYSLHHDHLLPRLEARIERWDDDPRIGDILVEFSPFLKMYSEYVQNFDNSLNLINYYKDKNSRFANVINDIQSMPECQNLPIQHHLIAPIQRIPRYRLLLEAYLKRLSNESNDKKDTEQALNIVSKAAEHANEAMRRIVSFKKLLEAQEQIRGLMDLVSPTRVLIKEGKINKISARTSESTLRYLFLLSDMLLLCSFRSSYLSGQKYQLRAKLEIAEVSVFQGDDLEIMNTFYIEDATRRIELFTDREDEKRDWMEAIYQAKVDLMERKSSLRLSDDFVHNLGIKEPPKIKKEVQMKCMLCDITFTMLKRRKRHCHACGIVICAKCSNSKLPLQYAHGKLCRVCDPCKILLQGKEAEKRKSTNDSGLASPDDPSDRVNGILDVPASDPTILCGYLNLRLRGRKDWGQSKDGWIPRYFCLRADFVLYSYGKHTDEKALCATPIPGLSISMVEGLSKNETVNIPTNEKERSFRITHTHGRKSFFFCAGTKEEALSWVNKLTLASNADFSGSTTRPSEDVNIINHS